MNVLIAYLGVALVSPVVKASVTTFNVEIFNTTDNCVGTPDNQVNSNGCFGFVGLPSVQIYDSNGEQVYSETPVPTGFVVGLSCLFNGQLYVGDSGCSAQANYSLSYCLNYSIGSARISCPPTSAPSAAPTLLLPPGCMPEPGMSFAKCGRLIKRCTPLGYPFKWVPKGSCLPAGSYGCQPVSNCRYGCKEDCIKAKCHWNSGTNTCIPR